MHMTLKAINHIFSFFGHYSPLIGYIMKKHTHTEFCYFEQNQRSWNCGTLMRTLAYRSTLEDDSTIATSSSYTAQSNKNGFRQTLITMYASLQTCSLPSQHYGATANKLQSTSQVPPPFPSPSANCMGN